MRYTITNEIAGRIRLRCDLGFIDDGEARGVAYDLMRSGLVRHAEVHPANQSLLVRFDPARREEVLAFIAAFDPLRLPREDEAGLEDFCNAIEMASENNRFQMQLAFVFMRRWLFRLLPLPLAMQRIWVLLRAIPFLRAGWQRLIHRELKVELLDAAAISASIMNGNWGEAGQIMFLLNLSGVMEDHVASRARLALRNGLITRADNVWAVIDGQDVRIPIASVTKGQILHLNAGSVLPVDGSVVEGEGELNEASMTGESRLVHKREGSTVYAGTALEDGDLKIRVTAPPGVSRIDGIVEMVEQSAQLKAGAQSKAERLSDALVPYNFAAFFALLAITRNVQKAMTVLMVDYSCAIKLSTPVAVGSAMDEAANFGMTVKGGKYLEKFAAADLIVFDKTGTLTKAVPHVESVISFDDRSENELLKLAACIEEHFPHSMARAIVSEAERRGLDHQKELHAEVKYVVAHGIRTQVGGKEVCIGSSHFLFDDEGVAYPEGARERIYALAPTASIIYMAEDGKLVGAICISDPLREEAASVISQLRALGVKRFVMLTGDSENVAANVAEQLGIDEYVSRVLPEDKRSYVEKYRAEGYTVAMVGDGINDSPALAASDVSLAMSDASDIARAVADISIRNTSLESLVIMRLLSQRVMQRIHRDYRAIVALNTGFIAGGVTGLITTTTAAFLHNELTFAVTVANTRSLLKSAKANAELSDRTRALLENHHVA